jgi:predicted nucleic acid-binding protein
VADGVVYLDTSALVKLLVLEAESAALRSFLADWPRRATSAVAEVELRRAGRRASDTDELERRALEVIGGLHLIEVDAAIRQIAASLAPTSLRSLDAIHIASALALGDSLATLVAYDERLLSAARASNLVVSAPGIGESRG